MRLEYVFDWDSAYEGESAVVAVDQGRRMWGRGVGKVSGERLSGNFSWCNHAHRNAGGVWHPDFHGCIKTTDGADILFDAAGYSVPNADDSSRALTCWMQFETADDRYAWLNDAIVVLEGSFVPKDGESVTRGFLCVRDD